MVLLALLLLGLGIAACVIVAIQVTDPITLSLLGTSIDTSAREIFFAGAITGAVMAAALWLLKSSTTRAHRRRQEMKDLRRHRRTEVERLEAEKAELQTALEDQRRQTATIHEGEPGTRIDLTDPTSRDERGAPDRLDLSKGATRAQDTGAGLSVAEPLGDPEGHFRDHEQSHRGGSTARP